MGIFGKLLLGRALTKATTLVEAALAEDAQLPIGMRNEFGISDRATFAVVGPVSDIARIASTTPRHVLTREMIKNMAVSLSLGRDQRFRAQSTLLAMMVCMGMALPVEEFELSYS